MELCLILDAFHLPLSSPSPAVPPTNLDGSFHVLWYLEHTAYFTYVHDRASKHLWSPNVNLQIQIVL